MDLITREDFDIFDNNIDDTTRREFLKTTAALGAGVALGIPGAMAAMADDAITTNGPGLNSLVDHQIPLLLLPIKVETRFFPFDKTEKTHLYIRFFPDTIAYTHNFKPITEREQLAGRKFWDRMRKIEQDQEEFYKEAEQNLSGLTQTQVNSLRKLFEKGETSEASIAKVVPGNTDKAKNFLRILKNIRALIYRNRLDAWAILSIKYGPGRAGWIARVTQEGAPAQKPENYLEGGYTDLMPDKFVVQFYDDMWKEIKIQFEGKGVAQNNSKKIRLGFDSKDVESKENKLPKDLQWIQDFNAACDIGMAMKIPINEIQKEIPNWKEGLNLSILGVKNETPEQSAALLKHTLMAHQYSRSGLELLATGMPTNNTDYGNSPYQRRNTDHDKSFKAYVQPLIHNFKPKGRDLKTYTDGEILAKALGIEFEKPFDGWWLEEYQNGRKLYDKNQDLTPHSRGLLPPIRIADQPYGILTISQSAKVDEIIIDNPKKDYLTLLQEKPVSDLGVEKDKYHRENADVTSIREEESKQTHEFEKKLIKNRDSKAKGIYIGCYAWIEGLKPKNIDKQADDQGGFIHAPSVAQAGASALLRSAYLQNTDELGNKLFEVNLTSKRVRDVKQIMDGLRAGLSIGELFGYRFERGLHDAELDSLIFYFRVAFIDDVSKLTKREESYFMPEKVLDGYDMIYNVKKIMLEKNKIVKDAFNEYFLENNKISNYSLNEENLKKLEFIVKDLLNALDALSDLMISEGIYQTIQGNYTSAAAVLTNLQKGLPPIDPEFIKTKRTGYIITNKVMLFFDNQHNPVKGKVSSNYLRNIRKALEPDLHNWLETHLAKCIQLNMNENNSRETFNDDAWPLPISAIDLFYLVDCENKKHVENNKRLLGVLNYFSEPENKFDDKLIEHLLPMLTALKRTILNAASIQIKDFFQSYTVEPEIDSLEYKKRVSAELLYLEQLKEFDPFLKKLREKKDQLSSLLRFEEAKSGLEKRFFATIAPSNNRISKLEKGVDFNDIEAMREIIESCALLNIPNLLPSSYLQLNKQDFKVCLKRVGIDKFDNLTDRDEDGKNRMTQEQKMKSQSDYETISWDNYNLFSESNDPHLLFIAKACYLLTFLKDKLDRVDALFKETEVSIANNQRNELAQLELRCNYYESIIKLFLGNDFKVIRKIDLDSNSIDLTKSFSRAEIDSDKKQKFVISSWVSGLSRVRPKMKALSQFKIFDGFYNKEKAVRYIPIQTASNGKRNPWISVDFSYEPKFKIEKDYTSLLFMLENEEDPRFTKLNKGILIDEWTEFIPNDAETTGVAFNYDQPNNEPPQVLLLCVASQNKWDGQDLSTMLRQTIFRSKNRNNVIK